MNETKIYLFGGISGELKTQSIQKLDLMHSKTWEVVDCKGQKSLSHLTSVTISSTEILLFGGKDDNGW